MRGISLSAMSLALVGACGSGPEAAENASGNEVVGLTVKAYEVRSNPGGPRNLNGRFEIREARNDEAYIADAAAKGGACLVAQLPIDPKSCTAASECAIPRQDFIPYCLQGQCWVRSDGIEKESCLKGVGKGIHYTPVRDSREIYTYLASIGETRPVSWRVIGLLRGTPVDPQFACLSDPAFMLDCGNTRSVP